MIDWNQDQLDKFINQQDTGCIYLYTPFCGTCQVASKMLSVVEEILPDLKLGKINLNYRQDLAQKWQIESVPCLLFFKQGTLISKIYTFHSVPYLIEKINKTLLD
ncbi:thioredoxin family protein [Niallia sp. Krafla_26]|uniref:thioredoxin family protein n=1 Tax=Niallia sp. Krafla_26 TaxID=3064703 RepID=UPI003D162A26